MKKRQTVWKALSACDGRLVSSQAHQLPKGLVRVYRSSSGRRLLVKDAFCFSSYEAALASKLGEVVWKAEAWGAVPIRWCLPLWREWGSLDGWPTGWTAHARALLGRVVRSVARRGERESRDLRVVGLRTHTCMAPHDTMLARRLRIVRPAGADDRAP